MFLKVGSGLLGVPLKLHRGWAEEVIQILYYDTHHPAHLPSLGGFSEEFGAWSSAGFEGAKKEKILRRA
jgi:hypothetical protein